MNNLDKQFPVSPEMKVIEEMGELTQAICKAERFGWFNYHPDKGEHDSNIFAVKKEIADVRDALKQLERKWQMQEVGE